MARKFDSFVLHGCTRLDVHCAIVATRRCATIGIAHYGTFVRVAAVHVDPRTSAHDAVAVLGGVRDGRVGMFGSLAGRFDVHFATQSTRAWHSTSAWHHRPATATTGPRAVVGHPIGCQGAAASFWHAPVYVGATILSTTTTFQVDR